MANWLTQEYMLFNLNIHIPLSAVALDTINGLDTKPLSYILFGTTCGVVGSIIDSLLVR